VQSHVFFLHRYCNNWSNSTHYFFVLIPDCSSAVANDGLLDPAGPGKLMKSELIEAAVMALFACKEDAWPVRRMPYGSYELPVGEPERSNKVVSHKAYSMHKGK